VNDELARRVAVLETINRLNSKLRNVSTAQEAFRAIAIELKQVTNADYAAIALVEEGSSSLRFFDASGRMDSDSGSLPLVHVDEDFRKKLAEQKQPVAMRFGTFEEIPGVAKEIARALDIEKVIISSILLRDEFLGYLAVGSKKESPDFSLDTEQIMTSLSDDVAIVVDNVRASLKLRRAKEETERILSHAPIGIMTLDPRGIFRSANQQVLRMLDKTSEAELIGTSVFELPVIMKSGLDALIMQGMEGTEGEKADVHIVPRSDKAYYLHVKVTPIRGGAGELQGVLLVAMDVSSKVRLENQLERSYEKLTQTYQELERVTTMKSQFIDVVSHELRTPLTVMRGYIDLVDSEYTAKLEPKFASRLSIIKANTDKLYALVESMLDVSRLEKGSLQIHQEPVRVDTILDEIVRSRTKEAEEKRQTLALDIEGKIPLIMADRRRLKDVFNNLVDNAVKYTQEGGRILVGVRDEGKMLHAWVKDNGIGIPLENLGKIFDRFHIVTSSELSRQVNRLGLGLPISKGIIEAHGGRIWVESQVGKGSVFHVDLPKEQPK